MTGIWFHENPDLSIILDYRTPPAIEFRSKLGSKQNDLTMTKEPSVLKRIMKIFASEKILLQHFLLSYRTDLYFPKHKLELEVDEKGHKNRDENKEIEKKKQQKKNLFVNLLELTLTKRILIWVLISVKYWGALIHQLKNH